MFRNASMAVRTHLRLREVGAVLRRVRSVWSVQRGMSGVAQRARSGGICDADRNGIGRGCRPLLLPAQTNTAVPERAKKKAVQQMP